MISPILVILFLAFLGSVLGLLGGVVFLVKSEWSRRFCKYAIPFAAGILLAVAFLDTIPESVEVLGTNALTIVLLAFVFAFIFEEFFAGLHHHEDRKHTMLRGSIPLVIFGDTVHNFIDGVAIASAYMVQPVLGLVVAIATFLHEVPHEIGDFGILYSAGWKKGKIILANLFSACSTFLGAIFTYYIAVSIDNFVGYSLAIAAGVFIYLGASDFLPEVTENDNHKLAWKELMVFIGGVVLMYLLTLVVPE